MSKTRFKREDVTPPTYLKFIKMIDLCSEDVRKEYLEILSHQPRPDTLCGYSVPKNLNSLTYGQLDDMRDIGTEKEQLTLVVRLGEVLFGKKLNIFEEDVNKVFGFVNFCAEELKRINALFAQIKPEYTSEERAAGVESLDFGSFGVLDWYAKRMGITNQNEVRNVAWVRIFQCMKNDHLQQMYERRLNNIYMKSGNNSSHNKHRR